MAKIIMLSGLPASGKSTKAEEILKEDGNAVRLNRDLLREMLHFNKWTGHKEGMTRDAQVNLAKCFLGKGHNVVIDDTNLGQSHLDRWKGIAKECDAKFEHVVMDTSIEDCIERDYNRRITGEHFVGKCVIVNMALQYDLYPLPEKLMICDIDGTLADITHRLHYVQGEERDWKGFFNEMEKDEPRFYVYEQHVAPELEEGVGLILMSGRPEEYRRKTELWLEANFPELWKKSITLIMRKAGSRVPDTEVKQKMLDVFIKDKSKVVKVVDDRPSVIRMWKSNGLKVVDVGSGVEF